MHFEHQEQYSSVDLVSLFEATFTTSEGAKEGATIAAFVERLLGETAKDDLRVFTAHDENTLVGAALFSTLSYAQDDRRVMILSPMAIRADRQGQGVGQALITYALTQLRGESVDIVITYGDPNFYGKVGFAPLSETQAPAPLPLSYPVGWIGQPLNGATFAPLRGTCRCVSALNDPSLW